MTQDYALALVQEAVKVALLAGAPVLGLGLAVGLLVALFQATTQINESSLQFLPKLLAAMVGFTLFGAWIMTTLLDFTQAVFARLPDMVR